MVDKNQNDRARGRYFLDRRNFVQSGLSANHPKTKPKSSGPMFPLPETVEPAQSDEKEVESKLKALYDSLNTSFWDTEPQRKKGHKPSKSDNRSDKSSGFRLQVSAKSNRYKNAVKSYDYKALVKQKKLAFPAVGLIAVLAIVVVFRGEPVPTSGQIASVKGSSKINYQNAGYTPMLPKAASKRDVVEAALKYEPAKKVFSYNDSLAGGKGIVTSQQPLPKEYKNDPISGLTAIASNVGASDWLATSKGKMYYGTNESGNGQMVVFTYRNILMLMRSGSEINPMTWKNYIDSLE